MALDNYADKQHTKQASHSHVVHSDEETYRRTITPWKKPKANGISKCRTVKVDGTCGNADGRSKAANKTRFWNDVLGESIKKVLKRGY